MKDLKPSSLMTIEGAFYFEKTARYWGGKKKVAKNSKLLNLPNKIDKKTE